MIHVGVCRFSLLVPGSHSLKEKRVVLRRMKDRAHDQGVTLAEVAGQDAWQRGDLAFALAAGDRDRAQAACESVLRRIAGIDGAQVTAARIEVVGFGDDWYAEAARSGEIWAEKAGEGDPDLSWVPADWLAPEPKGDP
jgi:hypothetical protein